MFLYPTCAVTSAMPCLFLPDVLICSLFVLAVCSCVSAEFYKPGETRTIYSGRLQSGFGTSHCSKRDRHVFDCLSCYIRHAFEPLSCFDRHVFDTDKRERGKWRGFGCMCGCGWRGYTMIYSTVNQVSGLDTCAYLHVYVFQRRYPNCHLNIDGLGNDNSRESADQCGNYAINECMDRSLCLVCSPIFRLLFPYAPVPSSLPFFFVLFLLLLLVILHLHLFLPSPLSSWSPFSPSFGLLSCTPLSSIVTVRTTTVFFFFPFSVSFFFSFYYYYYHILLTSSPSRHILLFRRLPFTYFLFTFFFLFLFGNENETFQISFWLPDPVDTPNKLPD